MLKFPLELAEDLAAQRAIRSRANTSLAILEKAFIHNGSGRYLVLRTNELDLRRQFDDSGTPANCSSTKK